MKTKTSLKPFAGLVLALLPSIVLGGSNVQRYQIHNVGAVPGRAQSWTINAGCLNDRGDIVGWSNDGGAYDFTNDDAFFWSQRSGLVPLQGLPGAVTSAAFAINNRGQAVGISGEPSPDSLPVVWDHRGVSALPLPEGFSGGWGIAINDQGRAGGMLFTPEGLTRAVVWDRGEPRLLPKFPDERDGDAVFSIHSRGYIVGQSAAKPAMWYRNQVTPLGTMGGTWGLAMSVNSRGDSVGLAATPEDASIHGVLWSQGKAIDLTPDSTFGFANSINERGQIVGGIGDVNFEGQAALWENGQAILLNAVIPANSGWNLIEADCINQKGQIAGFGTLHGEIRAFLLTPIRNQECDDRPGRRSGEDHDRD